MTTQKPVVATQVLISALERFFASDSVFKWYMLSFCDTMLAFRKFEGYSSFVSESIMGMLDYIGRQKQPFDPSQIMTAAQSSFFYNNLSDSEAKEVLDYLVGKREKILGDDESLEWCLRRNFGALTALFGENTALSNPMNPSPKNLLAHFWISPTPKFLLFAGEGKTGSAANVVRRYYEERGFTANVEEDEAFGYKVDVLKENKQVYRVLLTEPFLAYSFFGTSPITVYVKNV